MQPRREGYSEEWDKHSFNIVPADQVPVKADKAVPHGFDVMTGDDEGAATSGNCHRAIHT
jgi:hypothetical protein